jgi:signal transduction histidine kinase
MADGTARTRRRWRLGLRPLSIVVLAIFIGVAGVLFVVTRHLANDQERRLLNERTAEVGSLLSSAVGTGLQGSLTALAATAQQSPVGFTEAANSQLASGAVAAIALVVRRGQDWVVQATAGTALKAGQTLIGPRRSFVDAARGAQIHADVIVVSEGVSRLAVAIKPPTGSGAAVYEEYIVDPTRPTKIAQSQPFHELNVALYVGSRPDEARLLIGTTRDVPLRGRTGSSQVKVGDGTWLVVASARHPLAGTLANNLPKILSLVALLIGVAMTVLVESVSRRRDYALALVKARTAALRESMHELEHTQQALVANERMAALGEMAATVGHELRNPLSVLTNSLYLIRTKVSSAIDDKLARHLDTADREIAAATLIVSDLLEFSHPRTANPTPTDVVELIAESASVAPPPSGIGVEQPDGAVPPVVADRAQIRQVILNLLTNAYEAMPEGGTVRISARVVDDTVEVTVSDTGLGMDEQTIAQVFEPFFSMKVKGTGLGLVVSKRIVEAHSGALRIVSQPGRGCTAVMTLPLSRVVVGAGR